MNQGPATCLTSREEGRGLVGSFSYQGVARLKPGVTLEQASRA